MLDKSKVDGQFRVQLLTSCVALGKLLSLSGPLSL